ncbi:MAG: MotA/TolQ/ExbB proton channel family protein [Gemmatimonadota bacterium]|nr:MotA/TolQ/ExbB proton channel family protein [Gemmatimonadota bacterium]MDP6528729.1 MotA/TolQ/ExbB proton channel family protein [Gemmatimonadota bacterium]MDP7032149.1 MotA/TolQ/ExbB proton channel family protein [Gemmatimonadota bacterium]
MDHPFITTLMKSGPVGQTILAGLLLLSGYSWAVIVSKIRALRHAEDGIAAFLQRFHASGVEWLRSGSSDAGREGSLARVYQAGAAAYRNQLQIAGAYDALGADRVEATLDAEVAESVAELERGLTVLAVLASASPFVGLFGTVWGIMNAFRGMSSEGSAGIAAVAPGVAEALITTVAGLAVAIPAVVAYNLLNRRVRLLELKLDRFIPEFLDGAALASRGSSPGHSAEDDGAPVFASHDPRGAR